MLLRDVDSVTVKSLSRALEDIDMGANSLAEHAKRETQRRGAAETEYSSVLPPEVRSSIVVYKIYNQLNSIKCISFF